MTTKCSQCLFWHEVPSAAKAAAGVIGLKAPRTGACHGLPPQLIGTPGGLTAVRVNTAESDPRCSLFLAAAIQ